MFSTMDERIERAREAACQSLGVASDSLVNKDGAHTPIERDLLISLAARLVLQATDDDLGKLDRALAAIKALLESDYPHLADRRSSDGVQR
jgi:hypothetical protein